MMIANHRIGRMHHNHTRIDTSGAGSPQSRWCFSSLVMLLWALMMMALLSGCGVQSIQPVYSDDTLVFDERLLGSFEDDDGVWTFSRRNDSDSYAAVHVDDDGRVAEFEAHLAEINEALILDVYPEEWPREANEIMTAFTVRSHFFFRVDGITDEALTLSFMDNKWAEEYLELFPSLTDHFVDGDRVLLTADTERVMAFIGAHVRNADAWSEPEDFPRLPTSRQR